MEKTINISKNNILLLFVVCLTVVVSINIFPMIQTESQQKLIEIELSKNRGLLMFLDVSEKDELGAVGHDLSTALYQEAGPIIVANSLLCTLLELRAKDQRPIEMLVNERSSGESAIKKSHIIVSRLSFQPERWIIKKVNVASNILIPKQYLKELNIDINKVQEYNVSTDLTSDVELILGLKVNHMESVDVEQINRSTSSVLFADSLDSIFCKKADYKDRGINIPSWFIFVEGHGMTNRSIVGISLNSFYKVLTFLENKISTQLLMVNSCYAAGVNSQKIYGDMKLQTQKYYSFPIIIQGLNDVMTLSRAPSFDLDSWELSRNVDKKIQLKVQRDFASFLRNATSLKGDYREVISPIVGEFRENIPQIKMPGMEWFSIMEIDKKIVSIGSILAKTKDPQKPLDVVSYFKKDPEVILLYTDYIPFELKINSGNVRAVVSMVSSGPMEDKPELVIHIIKKISSSQQFLSVVNWFRLVVQSNSSKWFFIDEIEDKKNIIIFATNKDSTSNYYNVRVYYQDKDGLPHKAEFKKEEDLKFECIANSSKDGEDYRSKRLFVKIDYLADSRIKKRTEISSEEIKKIEDALPRREEIRNREKQKYLELDK